MSVGKVTTQTIQRTAKKVNKERRRKKRARENMDVTKTRNGEMTKEKRNGEWGTVNRKLKREN